MDDNSLWELRSYAQYLDWEMLEFACEEGISTRLEPSTVCLVWNVAEKNRATSLSELCQKFFTRHFAATATTANFFTLRKELLARALMTGEIECDEAVIIRALFIWARFQHHSIPENSGHPYDPLRYVGDLLPPSTLFNQRCVSVLVKHVFRIFQLTDNSRTKAAILGYGSPASHFM